MADRADGIVNAVIRCHAAATGDTTSKTDVPKTWRGQTAVHSVWYLSSPHTEDNIDTVWLRMMVGGRLM